jgi:hypothetical protein
MISLSFIYSQSGYYRNSPHSSIRVVSFELGSSITCMPGRLLAGELSVGGGGALSVPLLKCWHGEVDDGHLAVRAMIGQD